MGYFDGLKDSYRVVVMDYPPQNPSDAFVKSFTPDRVTADILEAADRAGAEKFAWVGYSWGGVVGLQLAARTKRLTALVCGGWPPIGAEYQEMVTAAALRERTGDAQVYSTYYEALRNWPETQVVSTFDCPRLTFAGTDDAFVAYGHRFHIGPTINERRRELEKLGWSVQMIEGFGHELGGRPDIVVPLVRKFLDPILLRAD
jgi:pimeloyl-ACP methyl ester carboxylesterase